MVRTKITARIPPDLAESLQRIAALKDRSVSEVVEDAIIKAFTDRGEAEHAALVVKLDAISRRLTAIERGQETHFELSAHAARFAMSVAPDIPDADKPALNARGSARFQNVLASIVTRLAGGKSIWREHFAEPTSARTPAPRDHAGVAAE
jgi:predicted transcriptional regulator